MSEVSFRASPGIRRGRDAVAVQLASGIAPAAIESWDEAVPRTPRVLVPVQLEALVVRAAGGTWADCRIRKPTDAESGDDLLTAPFTDLERPRGRGIYLHWALPDALTRGQREPTPDGTDAEPEQPTVFPPIPDRWLVARLGPGSAAGLRAVRAWVLQTEGEEPVVTELDAWREPGPPRPTRRDHALTAIGWGDPAWAAYYDNVEGRLGFYDDLQGVPAGTIAYLVCGWHADPAQDPLADRSIGSLVDFLQKLRELQWTVPPGDLADARRHVDRFVARARSVGLRTRGRGGEPVDESEVADAVAEEADDLGGARGPFVTEGSSWPKLTLYHGAAVGIGWPNHDPAISSTEAGGPPGREEIKISVGHTLGEAIAELVARESGTEVDARTVEAFQLGILRELGKPDGRAQLDQLLHASSFAPLPGGAVKELIWEPPPAAAPSLPAEVPTPDAGVFADRVLPPPTFEGVGEAIGRPVFEPAFAEGRLRTAVREDCGAEVERGGLGEVLEAIGMSDSNVLTPFGYEAGERPRRTRAGVEPEREREPEPQGRWVEVLRSLPRFWLPVDPIVLIQGGLRSFKHGGDGRFTDDGSLLCRVTGSYVTELTARRADAPESRLSVRADAVLERGLDHGGIPLECDDLLRELVYLDPGSARAAAQTVLAVAETPSEGLAEATLAEQAQNFAVEQTAWWAMRDPRVDHGPIVANSGMSGMLPSPLAVTPPSKPWNPRHLDWRIEYFQSPEGIRDWSLGEIGLSPERLPPDLMPGTGVTLEGRTLLTGGAAQALASAARDALREASSVGTEREISTETVERYPSRQADRLVRGLRRAQGDDLEDDGAGEAGPSEGEALVDEREELQDIVSALENMDVLAGALDGFHAKLRRDPWGLRATTESAPAGTPPETTPEGFVPLRAGVARIARLRLVDGYGQVLDLVGSSEAEREAELSEGAPLFVAEPMRVDEEAGLLALAPAFTAKSRLGFRFQSADVGDAREASADISPVCGFVLPDHLDGALEFFSTTGEAVGQIRPDSEAGAIWEDAPGRPSTVGQQPSRVLPNEYLAGVAEGLLDWGVVDQAAEAEEGALAALLRVIDTTRWTVDPFGRIGEEHHSLLVGHPVVVMRARLRLEVEDPLAPPVNALTPVPIRLGALSHWQDGLLGYFVGDDYRRVYCVDAAAAGLARALGPGQGFLQQISQVQAYFDAFSAPATAQPIVHAYVDTSGVAFVRPNQDVDLTLLVEPHGFVHATAGIVPRKEIGMRREWVADALAKLAPTFQFGPVLIDPKTIRMPIPTELPGTWTWDHRQDVGVWAEYPVVNATTDALLPADPAQGHEGWLKFSPPAGSPPGEQNGA